MSNREKSKMDSSGTADKITERANAAPPANYSRVCEPAVAPSFLPLPPGAVEPAGWLRDWAVAAREGITGHLDEISITFKDGWKGFTIAANGAEPDGMGWPLEQCAYWLDGAIRLGLVLHDEALIKKIRARLDPIVDGVNKADFGASFIYWKKDLKPMGFNGWAHSHLGRALVALYQGTGDKTVLDALVKVYADYPVGADPEPLSAPACNPLCNLDAMLETYSYSGDRRILDRALEAMALPSAVKTIEDWSHERLPPNHMVIVHETARLPGLVYPWSGDPRQLEATLGAFRWMDNNHMLPFGVTSGEENATGVGAFRKSETCNVAALLVAAAWMYRIQGAGNWGDRMERAFFNAGAAPIARDFKSVCYYQSPNRLSSHTLPCSIGIPGTDAYRFTPLGHPLVLCCVGAANRILPNYIIHMWMATRDNGLAATLYGPSVVTALAGAGVPVTVATTTDYPFNETVHMKVSPDRDVEFPLYVRIPRWCKQAEIRVNRSRLKAVPDDKGFVKIARVWSKGDTVELKFTMTPRVVRGFETEYPRENRQYLLYQPDIVFEPRRLPYASVDYGPLLFALPIRDLDANTPSPDTKWQYALDTAACQSDTSRIGVERKPMPPHWDWPLDAPVALTVPAQEFDWQPTDGQALPNEPVSGAASTVRLVPYGCTKFHISMFPVTSE